MSITLSRSKKRALGIRLWRNVSRPLSGELGRNQVAQTGTVLGSVEILLGGFFLRDSWSSFGETRYEDRVRELAKVMTRCEKESRGD